MTSNPEDINRELRRLQSEVLRDKTVKVDLSDLGALVAAMTEHAGEMIRLAGQSAKDSRDMYLTLAAHQNELHEACMGPLRRLIADAVDSYLQPPKLEEQGLVAQFSALWPQIHETAGMLTGRGESDKARLAAIVGRIEGGGEDLDLWRAKLEDCAESEVRGLCVEFRDWIAGKPELLEQFKSSLSVPEQMFVVRLCK